MLSIICVFNNEEILNKYLLSSLSKQSFQDYEIILIDSVKMNFKSAAKALNYAVNLAKGEVYIFVHQDIKFLSDDVLNKINEYSLKYQFGIGGVAGRINNSKGTISSIKMGEDFVDGGIQDIKEVVEVDTLDECLFFIKKENFLGFDEDLGDTYHLFATDYCYKAKLNNQKIYLFPLNVYHLSKGDSMNENYFKTLYKIGRKYHKKIKYLHTTCVTLTNNIFLKFFCFINIIKLKLKRKLVKNGN
ncbi:MAG: glycosyltransferase [Candidatus Onthovivens sp.]|nr:glycosyltransferase [Candidatus Onthovivens sp.]